MQFTLPGRGSAQSSPRRTYRQPAMLVPGVLLTVLGVVAVVIVLFDGGSSLRDVLWPIAELLVVWVIFLRPCVRLTQAGVELRNLVRDVRFGWPAIDLIEQRWNLKLVDEHGHAYGSWAIAAQRPRRAVARSGWRPGAGRGTVDPVDPADVMRTRPGSAAGVASAIRDAQLDYASATARDASYLANDEIVAGPAWGPIAALVLAVICVVVSVAG
ncbi:PH domain-containing protein [Flexivirga caeni]|uniref:PH domain-containing protein n=1 Tax=Flexivirga caeni TaxID=2294115 RepID=A0A3M9M9D0_9MICO|nr:PH domain-containing protein [Flexivirga caeni]RNI22154.1 hypothetical protein EFY87_09225 [Flexivirga caeni]